MRLIHRANSTPGTVPGKSSASSHASPRRWLSRVSVLVAHGCPLIAAGLVATLRELPGYDVALLDEPARTDRARLPEAFVHVLVSDVGHGAQLLARESRPPTQHGSRRPRLVLITGDAADPALTPALAGSADACLPMRCAPGDLLAAVRQLGEGMPTAEPAAPADDTASRGGLAPGVLHRVRAHIESRLARSVDLGELAGIAGLSSCHFARAFKRSTGVPPHRYLMMRRVAVAMTLIHDTDRSLCDIALEVGFADQSHFSRTFLQMTGQTPRAFRQGRR